MDELDIAKIQNTISEIENQISKFFIDTAVSKLLMTKSINQIRQLLTHIGYLESKIESTIDDEKLIDWVKDCPECAAAKIQILQTDVNDWKSLVKELSATNDNLIAENQRLSQISKY